jgi:hypothetical protein
MRAQIQLKRVQDERDALLRNQLDFLRNIQRSDGVFLRQSRKASSKSETTVTREIQGVQAELDVISAKIQEWNTVRDQTVINSVDPLAALWLGFTL